MTFLEFVKASNNSRGSQRRRWQRRRRTVNVGTSALSRGSDEERDRGGGGEGRRPKGEGGFERGIMVGSEDWLRKAAKLELPARCTSEMHEGARLAAAAWGKEKCVCTSGAFHFNHSERGLSTLKRALGYCALPSFRAHK